MMRLTPAALLAAFAVAAPSAAHAATSFASVVIQSITYTLYDLDPSDGVTPSMVFSAPSGTSAAYGHATLNAVDGSQGFYDAQYLFAQPTVSTGPFDIGSISTSAFGSTATVTSTASSASVSTTSTVAPTQGPFDAQAYATAYVQPLLASSVVVSAQSLLLMEVSFTMQASIDAAPHPYDFASANVYFQLSGLGAAGFGSQDSTSTSAISLSSGSGTTSSSRSGVLKTTFANLTDSTLSANVTLNGQAATYAYMAASAVPEPESVAMALAGLATVAAIGRRRQVSRNHHQAT